MGVAGEISFVHAEICLSVPHLKNLPSIVFVFLKYSCDDGKLIETKQLGPSQTVGSPEHAIGFGKVVHALVELTDVAYVVPPRHHPDSFHQVKEWVGVALVPEQHSFHGVAVGYHHGL